jgi:UDP-N-acetylmuramate dehydrogenase
VSNSSETSETSLLLHSPTVNIREQVPLAPLTTMQVGGAARFFAEATSADDVREALDFARSRNVPLFVLGGGSNLVVSDQGFTGLVLKVAISGISAREDSGKIIFEVGAGEDWDGFVAQVIQRNCGGVECLSGIPGTVGGTPVQNVGAYGQEVAETILRVRALEIESGCEREFTNAECDFAYRTSRFNTTDRGRYIILSVSFALTPGGAPKVAYADLRRRFADGSNPKLAEVRETVLATRLSKGMVIVDGDSDCRSAGSFFKNPVLTDDQFRTLDQRAAARGLTIPRYPALASRRKVSAAWLIEQAGFTKGYSRGPAGISSKHTLAIVNRGGAKASDIMALKNDIQRAVADQFGIELKPEPVFLGFEERATAK